MHNDVWVHKATGQKHRWDDVRKAWAYFGIEPPETESSPPGKDWKAPIDRPGTCLTSVHHRHPLGPYVKCGHGQMWPEGAGEALVCRPCLDALCDHEKAPTVQWAEGSPVMEDGKTYGRMEVIADTPVPNLFHPEVKYVPGPPLETAYLADPLLPKLRGQQSELEYVTEGRRLAEKALMDLNEEYVLLQKKHEANMRDANELLRKRDDELDRLRHQVPIKGQIIDSGGGQFTVMVDRSTYSYPEPGSTGTWTA
jgi:hypothetical protein